MTTGHAASPPGPTLAVRIGSESRTLDPRAGVAVIGRDPSAAVRVNDDRISRSHVRLEPRRDGWQVIDTSSNGMFVDGVRRSSVLITSPTTIHLGDADGIPVRAARSPSATLGQRLYGARHRAELSIEEAANAAGISTALLQDAESERPVPPDAAVAIDTLIAQLAMS